MSDLIAAERIRLLSSRSSHLFLAGSLLIAVAAAWLLGARLNIRPEYRASYPSLNDVFNADTGSLLMTLAGCFGAVSMTGEYSSGVIRMTCIAVPARARMMLAKALALAAVAAVTGAAVTAAVLLVALAVLSPGHYLAPLNQPAGPRVAVAFALLIPLGTITGLALGSVLRRPVTAVLAVVAVLAVAPGLAGPAARHLTMYGAWSVLANQPDPGPAMSVAVSWLVFCGWPIIAFTLATVVAQRRDIPLPRERRSGGARFAGPRRSRTHRRVRGYPAGSISVGRVVSGLGGPRVPLVPGHLGVPIDLIRPLPGQRDASGRRLR